MSRIGHDVPMRAYDHIRTLLNEAGGKDGVISRKDADKLVDQLRSEGRGTEALAASNLFKMIDHLDDDKGARVTGFDLNLSRGFVEARMLENRDKNSNGFSKAEIGKMSPTARALVELGQFLSVETKGGRVAKAIPEMGMNHIAALLIEASGKDPITSRKDADRLFDALYQQGRGTEALAAKFFYGFIDHRDHKDGARISEKDIDRAVEYAKEHLLENKDKNNNGYSAAEMEKFSTTAKAFLLVGQMIDAGIIKSAAAD